MNFRTLLHIKSEEIFKYAPVRYMTFMDEKVPDVVTVVQNKTALSGEDYCFNDGTFFGGHYTGQRGTKSGVIVRHGYGRMNYENGDWYQGNWVMNSMQGTGFFYHKKRNYGYQGEFYKNRAVKGTYYFGNLINYISLKSESGVDVMDSAFWLAVHMKYQKETSPKEESQSQKVNALLAQLSSLY